MNYESITPRLNNNVNHPDYYNQGNIEVIDIIDDYDLGFNLGNVIKYVLRAGKKSELTACEDLEKAAFYLNREIKRLKRDIDYHEDI